MLENKLSRKIVQRHAERVRRDPNDLYAALGLVTSGHMVSMQFPAEYKAALTGLVRNDPYFVAASLSFSYFNPDTFTQEELERLSASIDEKADEGDRAYLRARLWGHCVSARHASVEEVRRLLDFLRAVPPDMRDGDIKKQMAECFRRIDYPAYREVMEDLLRSRNPMESGFHIPHLLEKAAEQKDWETYDRWRSEWDNLPVTASICECARVEIANLDGLRALDHEEPEKIPGILKNALNVTGCPHLNSFGPRIDLVQELLRRKIHVEPAMDYLRRAVEFGESNVAAMFLAKLEGREPPKRKLPPGFEGLDLPDDEEE